MQQTTISRRHWLKSSVLLGTGLALAPASLRASTQKEGLNPFTGEFVTGRESKDVLRAKLNANENPYGPSKRALEAFRQSAETGNRYPFDLAMEFREIIAKHEGVTPEHIFIGAGSSEVLTMTGLAFGIKHGAIMSAFPTFQTMMDTAVGIECDWQQIPLNKEYKHDLEAMEDSITDNTKLVYICNPNNPTGTIVDTKELRGFCERVSGTTPIFVDEAYTDFIDGGESMSMVGLVKSGANVIVARTFSKIHGMAGLRIGYGIAKPELVEAITKYSTRLVTISGPAIHAAIASYDDEAFKKYCRGKNKEARDYTFNTLKEMGFNPIPSNTSFMIFPIEMEPETYLQQMTDKSVGVRSWVFDDKNWCRVSIGTLDEMKIFTSTVKEVLKI